MCLFLFGNVVMMHDKDTFSFFFLTKFEFSKTKNDPINALVVVVTNKIPNWKRTVWGNPLKARKKNTLFYGRTVLPSRVGQSFFFLNL